MKSLARPRAPRDGAVVPIVVVLIILLLTISCITINSNWLLYHRINAQNTADLAAMSALARIQSDPDTGARIYNAKVLGSRIYDLNYDRASEGLDSDEVQLGFLVDPDEDEPTFVRAEELDAAVSAVQILEPQSASNSVQVFLANMLGANDSVRIVANSTVGTKAVDIMLCLDASRSMNRLSSSNGFPSGGSSINEPPLPGSRWFELKDTVRSFLDELRETNPNARVGLVTFGGGWPLESWGISGLDYDMARTELEPTLTVSDEVLGINDTLDSYATNYIALGRGTSIYDGIQDAVAAMDNPNATRHIVLLSDGQPWQPGRPNTMVAAANAANKNITIHTISFSGTFSTLVKVAEETSGLTFTASNQSELNNAFHILAGCLQGPVG